MFLMPVSQSIIRLLARYSEGARLAVEHGPQSGMVFEYAYRNQPQGSGAVARWVDRAFLRLPAWEGVRRDVESTKEILAELVLKRRAHGGTTMVLDVASGTARYLRELVREHGGEDLVIACHDRNPREVMLGRQLVAGEGLFRFTFSVGDATDDSSYLTSRDPDIVLAIGIFPLLQRDAAVRAVMRLAFNHLAADGCFVCTTVAKPAPRGMPWETDTPASRGVGRAPETLIDWLAAAGFVHIEQRRTHSDGWTLTGWKPAICASDADDASADSEMRQARAQSR